MGRTLIRHSSNPRPSTLPYVTGDGFRNFADHIYDKASRTINPKEIKDRDVVFVGDSLIRDFLAEIHPLIQARYILVTHNGDAPVDAEGLALAGDKVLRWYGTNVTVDDPRVVPIPIGIENKHWYLCGIPSVFKSVIRKRYPKRDRIFYGFTVSTNQTERQPALDAMKRNPLAETLRTWRGFGPYLHLLATYKFVASPPGSSVEGHRTWEALYIGMVPIVKSSITIDYFERISLPIWSVKDWGSFDGMTEQSLAEKFDSIMATSNKTALYLDYWTDKIRNIRD